MEAGIRAFLEHYEKVRGRTSRVVDCIPADRVDWTWRDGKFTLGDLVRHIAAIERYMYAENVQGKPSRYPGDGRGPRRQERDAGGRADHDLQVAAGPGGARDPPSRSDLSLSLDAGYPDAADLRADVGRGEGAQRELAIESGAGHPLI